LSFITNVYPQYNIDNREKERKSKLIKKAQKQKPRYIKRPEG